MTEDATTPCIRYGELYTKFGVKIDKVYSYTNMPPEKLRFSKGTEVLIPRVGEDPMDYNHCTWLSLKDVAIGEMISVFNTDQDPLFSATMFNATLQKEFAIRVEGGSVTNLYFDKLRNIDISYPSLQEQKMIASFFENIDNLITLHQRKYDNLVKTKKSMLQKMFPRDGATVPEIRFKRFTGDWVQRKVSEVAEVVGGGTPSTSNPEYWDGDINWYAPAEIGEQIYVESSERKITELGLEKSSAKILPAHKTVLFTSRAGIGNTAILQAPAATNQGFQSMVLHDDINPYFVYSMTDMIKAKAERVASGSTFAEISGKMLGNLEFMFPSKPEQDKIGGYFESLDNLITLHQRKCDTLKSIKKYMLQNMFPKED
ncbi:MAG: restriction endonuclease subunit S [Lachnospiraceae bacterium]|nr:restriction endonuclease subunit S [Lachnospiraceae bacterium]